MKIFVETERLLLREITPADAQGFYDLDSDPAVVKYLGNQPATDIQQCRDTIEWVRKQYRENGIGRWAIVEKESNQFVGWTGLKYVKETVNNHTNFYDVGYRLIKKFWGKGYATESGFASLQYGFEQLKLKEIYAAADVNNLASRNVLEKLRLKQLEKFEYYGRPHLWYKIGQEGFQPQTNHKT